MSQSAPNPVGPAGTDDLLAVLDVTTMEEDRYLGVSLPMHLPRIFGGQVLAQALISAGRTVRAGLTAHSLHANFLRPGDPGEPIEFQVDSLQDGRQLSRRSVAAVQHGRPIASVTVSFAAASHGVVHQVLPPQTPAPAQVPTFAESAEAWGGLHPVWDGLGMIDIRVDPRTVRVSGALEGRQETLDEANWADRVWQRIPGDVSDDPAIHQALLVYLSDTTLLSSALVPHGIRLGDEQMDVHGWDCLSLDHAMWFHAPVRADQWLLFDQSSPAADGGRALCRAGVFTEAGRLVASVAQEMLLRATGDPPQRLAARA